MDNTPGNAMLQVKGLSKTFTLHAQGGAKISVFNDLSLSVAAGECLALHGPSGAGKSTLLRSLYANYKPCAGSILVRHKNIAPAGSDQTEASGGTRRIGTAPESAMNGRFVDMVQASPREVMAVRKHTIGYVSQFLRVIPRVSSLRLVMERLTAMGTAEAEAREQASALLERLRIPQRLWDLAPATFSGGEQQRVNIARGFIRPYPIFLLDEPTASLDKANRQTVVDLIFEAKARGAAVVGIFHDDAVRLAVAERSFDMSLANTNQLKENIICQKVCLATPA